MSPTANHVRAGVAVAEHGEESLFQRLPSPVCGRGVGGEGTFTPAASSIEWEKGAVRTDSAPLPALRHPISRWYLCPAASWLAGCLSPTRLRPVQVTLAGLALGAAAAALIVWRPELAPLAAVLVLGAWLLDRVDGNLARRQRTASAWGAWLDAAVDELLDVGLHVALAAAAASRLGSAWPWGLVAAFLGGKYLLVHGLGMEEQLNRRRNGEEHGSKGTRLTRPARWLRAACHLPGNADVRVHLLALALASGWFCVELALVAAYYNLRWIARYFLVARRLGGER